MGKAKDIVLRPIDSRTANVFVRRVHYSGKVVQNSQLHIGVFLNGALHGVMQFGPSLDKRKIQGLVKGTRWHEFIELNRMAFDDVLPRNSESRAIAVAMKLLRQHAPQLKWVISFADATQCGDGTIYRASGFVLTGITKNTTVWELPGGGTIADNDWKSSITKRRRLLSRVTLTKGAYIKETGGASVKMLQAIGANKAAGFQLRYIYFLDPSCRQHLTVPELPYSAIAEAGAKMYKGEKLQHAGVVQSVEHQGPPDDGGSIPTRPLYDLTAGVPELVHDA